MWGGLGVEGEGACKRCRVVCVLGNGGSYGWGGGGGMDWVRWCCLGFVMLIEGGVAGVPAIWGGVVAAVCDLIWIELL